MSLESRRAHLRRSMSPAENDAILEVQEQIETVTKYLYRCRQWRCRRVHLQLVEELQEAQRKQQPAMVHRAAGARSQ